MCASPLNKISSKCVDSQTYATSEMSPAHHVTTSTPPPDDHRHMLTSTPLSSSENGANLPLHHTATLQHVPVMIQKIYFSSQEVTFQSFHFFRKVYQEVEVPAVPGLEGYDNNNVGDHVMNRLHQTTNYQTTSRIEKAAMFAASAPASKVSNRRSAILECTPTGQAPAPKQYQHTKKVVSSKNILRGRWAVSKI